MVPPFQFNKIPALNLFPCQNDRTCTQERFLVETTTRTYMYAKKNASPATTWFFSIVPSSTTTWKILRYSPHRPNDVHVRKSDYVRQRPKRTLPPFYQPYQIFIWFFLCVGIIFGSLNEEINILFLVVGWTFFKYKNMVFQ